MAQSYSLTVCNLASQMTYDYTGATYTEEGVMLFKFLQNTGQHKTKQNHVVSTKKT